MLSALRPRVSLLTSLLMLTIVALGASGIVLIELRRGDVNVLTHGYSVSAPNDDEGRPGVVVWIVPADSTQPQ